MVPILGGLSLVEPYSLGHKRNIGSRIRIVFDKVATSSEVPLVCPAVFGDFFHFNLYGSYNFYGVGCFVGVPFGAEGATQKNFKPKEGSPLSLILESN